MPYNAKWPHRFMCGIIKGLTTNNASAYKNLLNIKF